MLPSLLLVLSAALQLTRAIEVYLSPPSSFLASKLAPEQASAALSRHLGLEAFEPFQDASLWTNSEENFVGQGSKNVLLLTGDQDDVSGMPLINRLARLEC